MGTNLVNFQDNIYVLTGPGGTGEINPVGSFFSFYSLLFYTLCLQHSAEDDPSKRGDF